jgi:hypothetical protein
MTCTTRPDCGAWGLPIQRWRFFEYLRFRFLAIAIPL